MSDEIEISVKVDIENSIDMDKATRVVLARTVLGHDIPQLVLIRWEPIQSSTPHGSSSSTKTVSS